MVAPPVDTTASQKSSNPYDGLSDAQLESQAKYNENKVERAAVKAEIQRRASAVTDPPSRKNDTDAAPSTKDMTAAAPVVKTERSGPVRRPGQSDASYEMDQRVAKFHADRGEANPNEKAPRPTTVDESRGKDEAPPPPPDHRADATPTATPLSHRGRKGLEDIPTVHPNPHLAISGNTDRYA